MKIMILPVCSIFLIIFSGIPNSWAFNTVPRTIDGTGNNINYPEYGSAGAELIRKNDASGYSDPFKEPTGKSRQSARFISNALFDQRESVPNLIGASDFVWQWGQFVDHDIDLTTEAYPPKPFYIAVPPGDSFFDPDYEGDKTIPLNRSIYKYGNSRPRQQLNQVTAFIDASNVYGSDSMRADFLRTFEGGKLKTTRGERYLPFNTEGLPNAGGPDPKFYLAGDVRANEQIALTAMHTLFVREHNRLCDEMLLKDPGMTDEDIYQWARKIVGAQMQIITYNEFLPILLGEVDLLSSYPGYDEEVDPGISNEFSTAAYRLGHSMLSPQLIRINRPGKGLVSTSLKDAFFNPRLIHKGGGIDTLLRGLATQTAQEVDIKVVHGVRNFLFGEPGEGGFDLVSLNIQRGRDHGIPDYNSVRVAYGLEKVDSFDDITDNPEIYPMLKSVYVNVDDIDLWVGGLAEKHMPGAIVGETFHRILVDQFVRLRDGDRFWYQNDPFFLENLWLTQELEGTRLADIIRRNTRIHDIQDNVFLVQ
jgi:hypothetical protein